MRLLLSFRRLPSASIPSSAPSGRRVQLRVAVLGEPGPALAVLAGADNQPHHLADAAVNVARLRCGEGQCRVGEAGVCAAQRLTDHLGDDRVDLGGLLGRQRAHAAACCGAALARALRASRARAVRGSTSSVPLSIRDTVDWLMPSI